MSFRRLNFFVIPLLVAALVAFSVSGLQAQSLEERVERLEQQMQDDDLPGDAYVSEFGGRIMADWTFNVDGSSNLYGNSGAGATDADNGLGSDAEDGFEFRRLRLYAEGAVARDIDYKVQLDFAGTLGGGQVDLKDAYISLDKTLIGIPLKIGHFKEPFSLNELTSSKYITFMSRSALSDGFTPEYNPGVQTDVHFADNRVNFTVGAFTPDDQQQPATGGSYNLTGRLTSPVLYQNGGDQLVHLGAAYSLRGEGDQAYTSDLEPEVHKGDPEFLEVDIQNVTNSTATGLEFASVFGPLSAQAEWAQNSIERQSGRSIDLTSQYAFVSYILTGEKRPYDPAAGDFGRIDVASSTDDGGMGAWEIAARYSSTDYTDAQGITASGSGSPVENRDINQDGTAGNQADADDLAGEMSNITLGLNWYPTSHSRWMLNYVDAEQETLNGDAQWVTTRFQVDF